MHGLIALGIIFVAFILAMILFPEVFRQITRGLGVTLLVGLGLLILGMMVLAMTDFNLEPMMRNFGVKVLAGGKVVDFHTLLPEEYRVQEVDLVDTDGDGQDEWVVFYQFDLADGRSPYAGAIYDYDRGNPPIVFPYKLVPPDRDYLSEGQVSLDFVDIVPTPGESAAGMELMVRGWRDGLATDMTMFLPYTNTIKGESPSNSPPRYLVIGNFRGDGGATYDEKTKQVTVINLAHDRSQLAVKQVYALDAGRNSYMALSDGRKLSPPVSESVTFAFGMPKDIKDTPYPEKKVLAFYQMLGANNSDASMRSFLTGEALMKYNQHDWAYFGFEGVSGNLVGKVSNLAVTELTYSPQVEEFEPFVTSMDQTAQYMIASIAFDAVVDGKPIHVVTPIPWVTMLIDDNTTANGTWKIDRRANQ